MKTEIALAVATSKTFGAWKQATASALAELRATACTSDALALMVAELQSQRKQVQKASSKAATA